jgi:phage major head subunit gpT-like protein
MMTRPQYMQLMAPGLHSLFVHWLDLKQRETEYTFVFNEDTSDSAFEDIAEFSGIGPFQVFREGEAVQYQDIIEGGTYRYQHTPWALGMRMSHLLIKDDKYKLINQAPKCLARSAHFVKEMQTWNILNLSFTTQTVIDGLALCHTSHPLLGGPTATNIAPGVSGIIASAGTYPNKPVTDVDLSFTAIQLAINTFERLPDSQGMPITMRPKYLVIPPELKWIAREILGSPHKPYTADNEINSLIKEDLSYFVGHYLTSTSAWWLVGDKESHTMTHMTREALEDDYSDDFDTRSIKQIATMRFSTGAENWLGVWGSNGP